LLAELDAELERELDAELEAELEAIMAEDSPEIKPILNTPAAKTASPPFIQEKAQFTSQYDPPSVTPEKPGFFSKLIKAVQSVVKIITDAIDSVFKPSAAKLPSVKASTMDSREESRNAITPDVKHAATPSEPVGTKSRVWQKTQTGSYSNEQDPRRKLSEIKESMTRVEATIDNYREIQKGYRGRMAERREVLAARREDISKDHKSTPKP